MDNRRFDALTRSLAAPRSRRGFLGTLAALGAGLLVGRAVDAQVTQAQCGNKICASNPAVCTNGCVCCVYSNGNSRCRPPGTCSPGEVLCPPGQVLGPSGTCAAPTTTTTTTTTAAPVCTLTDTTCTSGVDVCSPGCYCRPSTEGTTFCGVSLNCGDFGYCNSSADCDANERCALNLCCGREPGTECCPLTGGVCVPTCGASTFARAGAFEPGPHTSPPSPDER